jgi:hypothetical protein
MSKVRHAARNDHEVLETASSSSSLSSEKTKARMGA